MRMVHVAAVVAFLAAVVGCSIPPPATRPIDPERVPVQFGGGGARKAAFRISPEQWGEIAKIMAAATSGPEEREAMCLAIGRIEQIAGEQTITWMDKARNGNHGPTEQGQMDCIDESTNTTNYLRLMEQKGLFRWNRVVEIAWRAPRLVDTHRTAVVEDLADGRRYVIDSWFGDNGEPAKTQPLEDWKRKAPFPER